MLLLLIFVVVVVIIAAVGDVVTVVVFFVVEVDVVVVVVVVLFFRLWATSSLPQNDVKCREKLKIDRTNSEHAGYRLTFLPQSRASLNRDEYA